MQKTFSPFLQISLCTFSCLYATSNTALAQVTPDGTVNTQVNQNGNVAEITGGETRGANLFHSFQDFSVNTGNEAFFKNADSISNIFSRVTGGQGNAGLINITASGDVTFDGETSQGSPGNATSGVDTGAEGNAGGVTISTANLTLTNEGNISNG